MSTEKRLGHIARAEFGYGGYQDAQFGLSLTFEGGSWGVGTFIGYWGLIIKADNHTEWTEADRDAGFAKTVRLLDDTLRAAKKTHVAQLVGTPVEVTFRGMALDSWRVLTEVL